ncbi:hypothetical protein CSKR_112394 [Clonorchis sinensis]|uniref:Uncharacterized protein n=2 Tax=Clonorchis sinensis TaxID=79923 RepID=A0A8T1M2Y7_CLOSI|nr:hypothetical protein CSKR_112394 [Clonorchis sinensis]GAA37716.1 hypothetical protein CLF_103391 [Clonorchis sinensis]
MSRESSAKRNSGIQSNRSSRNSTNLNGSAKDKQAVFFRCKVCTVARSQRKSSDALDENIVGKLLSSQMERRHSHGAELKCLEDRLNFKKNKLISKGPFRNWVLYSDIEHYFVFPQHPKMFMLAIRSDIPGKSHFETYKCKTEEETNRLCEFVCRACQDPSKKLCTQNTGMRPYSTLSEVSVHSTSVSQPNLWTSEEADDEKLDGERGSATSVRSNQHSCSDSPIPNPVAQNMVEQCPEFGSPTEKPVFNEHMKQAPSVYKTPLDEEQDEETDKTTYFNYHPIYGAVLNEDGPIYMYMRRFVSESCLISEN